MEAINVWFLFQQGFQLVLTLGPLGTPGGARRAEGFCFPVCGGSKTGHALLGGLSILRNLCFLGKGGGGVHVGKCPPMSTLPRGLKRIGDPEEP